MDRSLAGYSPKDCKELDIADQLSKQASKQCDALDYCSFFFLLTPDVKYFMSFQLFSLLRKLLRDFPGGNTVDKNLPASQGTWV